MRRAPPRCSVDGGGDVDGDGLDDLLMGAPIAAGAEDWMGRTYLLLGSNLGSTREIDLSPTEYSFVGENTHDFAGGAVAGAGDVDGDGVLASTDVSTSYQILPTRLAITYKSSTET